MIRRTHNLVNHKHSRLLLQLAFIQALLIAFASSSEVVEMADNSTQSALRNQIAGKRQNNIAFHFQFSADPIQSSQLPFNYLDFLEINCSVAIRSLELRAEAVWGSVDQDRLKLICMQKWLYDAICVIYWASPANWRINILSPLEAHDQRHRGLHQSRTQRLDLIG